MSDPTHPTHVHHPDHPDNHPHRAHHIHHPLVRGILGIFILVVLVLMVGVGLITNAPFGSVILAFTPSIVLGLIGVALLQRDMFDLQYLAYAYVLLLFICGIAFAFLIPSADVTAVIALNVVLGAFLLLIISQSYHRERSVVVELEQEQQDFGMLIGTLEDRCKAINFVIGRVYSVHHGATAGMRKKINFDSDWYNELSAARHDGDDEGDNEPIIRGAVEKIKRRLEQFAKKEKDVFTDAEIKRLKTLERDEKGNSNLIEVLSANDSDPVEQYIISALTSIEAMLMQLDED